MEPEIITNSKMYLVGVIESGKNLSDVNIGKLWKKFETLEDQIKHEIPGIRYEIHIENKNSQPVRHFCFIGIEVEKIEDIPIEMFVKEIPEGEYVSFTHQFKDGGFKEAFEKIYTWLKNSKYKSSHPFDIQSYDPSYKGPDDPNSEVEILIPVEEE